GSPRLLTPPRLQGPRSEELGRVPPTIAELRRQPPGARSSHLAQIRHASRPSSKLGGSGETPRPARCRAKRNRDAARPPRSEPLAQHRRLKSLLPPWDQTALSKSAKVSESRV